MQATRAATAEYIASQLVELERSIPAEAEKLRWVLNMAADAAWELSEPAGTRRRQDRPGSSRK